MSAPDTQDLAAAGPAAADAPEAPEAPQERRWWLRGVVPWLLYAVLLLAIAGLLLLALQVLQPAQIMHMESLLRSISQFGILCQIAAALWAVGRWRRIVAWGRRRGFVKKQEHRAVLQLRWRVAGWLGLYLLLIPIGPRRLAMAVLAWFH